MLGAFGAVPTFVRGGGLMTDDALRVLLVADSSTDAVLVLAALRREGRAVEHERVEDAAAMRVALDKATWHVVISEWSMPSFTAAAALDVLKKSGKDLPFLIVSRLGGEAFAVEAMRAGARDYLLKQNLVRLGPAIEREISGQAERAVRRGADVALRESEARYRRIVETTSDGVAQIDVEGKLMYLNARLAAVLGYEPAELLGRSILELVDVESRAGAAARISDRTPGPLEPVERAFIRKDGTRVWMQVESTAIVDDAGRHQGRLVMMRDVTDRKRAEEALRHSEEQLRQGQKMEAVGRLAGGVAHDFNNVLSVILSYSEMMLETLPPSDPMRDDVEEILKAGRRAADLTRQLLLFSRQQIMEPKVVDLNALLADMDKMLQRVLGEDVALVSTARSIGRVMVDPTSIGQVVMNLAVNARDAMPTGGKLTIETGDVVLDDEFARAHVGVAPGRYVMLAVSDTGTGMDKATLAQIFEPFFTTKARGKGTGLGLSTAFGIVRQSGGTVWVYSEPDHGTTFKVYLPRVDAPADVVHVTIAPATLRGSETILLVEDEDQVRAVARGILVRSGYDVMEARSGGEALLMCEKHPGVIHLLLSDVVMPQMSGAELAKRLASERPSMKVLCMSGYTDDSIVRHGVLDANFAFLQKPLTPETLTRKVREVLDAPARARVP